MFPQQAAPTLGRAAPGFVCKWLRHFAANKSLRVTPLNEVLYIMSNPSVTKFFALAIGALMVGNLFSNLAVSVFSLDEVTLFRAFAMFLMPVIFEIFLAWLVFSYAKRLDLQLATIHEERFLYSGLKLLGFCLLAFGIPPLVSGLGFLLIETEIENSRALFYEVTVSSVVEIFIGYALLWHTPKFMSLANRELNV